MDVISAQQILQPLLLSAKTVGVCMILFLSLGTALAYLLALPGLRFRWLLDTLVTLPLIFPPIALGFFLLVLLGKNSVLGAWFAHFDIYFIFSFHGLVLAGFISGLPLMVKPLQSALQQFPPAIKDASYAAGKSTMQTLIFVILPSIRPALFAALLISSARAMGEVGITLMLGGNIVGKTDTISLAIYNAVFDGDHTLATVLSAILVSVSLLFFALLQRQNNKNFI